MTTNIEPNPNGAPKEENRRSSRQWKIVVAVVVFLGAIFTYNLAVKPSLQQKADTREWKQSVWPAIEAIPPAVKQLNQDAADDNVGVPEMQASCTRLTNIIRTLEPKRGLPAPPSAAIEEAVQQTVAAGNKLEQSCLALSPEMTEAQSDTYVQAFDSMRENVVNLGSKIDDYYGK